MPEMGIIIPKMGIIYTGMYTNKKDLRQLYNQIKQGAKKRGIPFELTMSDLNNLSFPISCPVLGIPLTFNTGEAKANSYSIDRIDSSKGYTIDNIVIVSNRANTLKSDATLAEMKKLVEFYEDLV